MCLLALAAAACSPDAPEGAKLSVVVIGDSEQPEGLAQRLVAEAVQPGLVARDEAGQTVAGLASSWRFVDDGRSLILRLRPAQWSNGETLVARDVVAAFRRAGSRRDPVLVMAGIVGSEAVTAKRAPASKLGVSAPIARVVELRLESPSPLLLGWLAEPALGLVSDKADVSLARYRVGGTAERRVLQRKSMAASPAARPAQISVATSPDLRAAIAGFMRGEANLVFGDGLAGLGEVRASVRPEMLQVDPLWGIYGYVANGLRGPVADPAIRRALAMAVDRGRLAAAMGIGAIVAADGLLPPLLAGGAVLEEGDWRRLGAAARVAEARRLLAGAGWTLDQPLRLVLLLPPGREHRSIAERVADDWAQVGVLLAVTEVSAVERDKLLARGDFDLAVTEASVPVPDSAALLMRWRCGAGAYCNPEADTMLAAARRAPAAGRAPMLAAVEARMMTAPPMIPLITPVQWTLVGRNVDGWVPNAGASHPLARLTVGVRRR
ncbi:peptide ABC transporter substrate-binding protein [Polymorphobacter glacialis]|uniref:Peptide ABC transporter substrate-binding protein n=1 Tax=Sandarakinorhabdus glacialis TaxID=1614636 RepID=A0A917E9F1_9SPHN|nr:peptide ABC transporter substrate-binding protein [Polymorphobacter glacialis]